MAQDAPGRSTQSYADTAATLIESYVRSDLFSGTVLVAQDGKPIFRQAYGLANREWNIPNAPDTKFRIGSITKQFTAAAILRLAERGKLGLDDLISTHYAKAPASWEKITLRHLLSMRSGIPNYTNLPDFFKKQAMLDHTLDEVIELTRSDPLNFEPGSAFEYSNSNYMLLGYVIEKTSGSSYRRYLQDNLFGPLGMRDSDYDATEEIVERRALGYRRNGERWENASYLSMTVPQAAGGLISTVDDLLAWDQAMDAGKVLDPNLMRIMFTDHGDGYGLGWAIGERFGRRLQHHGGDINGFSTKLGRYPDGKLTIVVLSNLEGVPADKIASELAAIHFGLGEPPRVVPVDAVLLDRYVGHYQLGPKFIIEVSREGKRLLAQGTKQPKLEVFPSSETTFFYKTVDARITFEADAHGQAARLVLHQYGRDLPGQRVDAAEAKRIEEQPAKEHKEVPVNPKLLDGYVGRYRLFPDFILTISREGDRLFGQATGPRKNEIFAAGDRGFFYKAVDAQITFETDAQGRATHLILHQGGMDTPGPRIE